MVEFDEFYMLAAIKEANKAFAKDEIPVGGVAVSDGKIITRGHNLRERKNNPISHCEMLLIEKAAKKLKNWRLNDITIYVTLEPCIMCIGAMLQARVKRLVYGADDFKGGAVKSLYRLAADKRLNHQIEVTSGVLADKCGEILSAFFKKLREKTSEPLR